jgi:small GTP-binding protein
MQNGRFDFDEFVDQWKDSLRIVWEGLPEETQGSLRKALALLPGDIKSWRSLVDQAIDHLRLTAGSKHRVAIVGPVNVGKSTLYNQLIRSKGDRAQVSAVPGTTRMAHAADAGIFTVIDTPGADAPGAIGETERSSAIEAAKGADILILLFDAAHGIRAPEQALFIEIVQLGIPFIVALNKMDLVGKNAPQVIGSAAGSLGIPSDQIIPISAKKAVGLEKILVAIAKSQPGIVAALGAALPAYRSSLSQNAISKSASTAAAIAVTPLPFLDFFPLLGVQAAMVLSIARIYAFKITLSRARELVATFGMAVVGRTLFYELSKLGGPPGWLLAAGVAAGTTTALGYAAMVWFERGERVSRDTMTKISRAISDTIIDRLRGFGKRKPNRMTLKQRVRRTIDEIPDVEEIGEEEKG